MIGPCGQDKREVAESDASTPGAHVRFMYGVRTSVELWAVQGSLTFPNALNYYSSSWLLLRLNSIGP